MKVSVRYGRSMVVVFSLALGIQDEALAQPAFQGIIESRNTTTDERGRPQQFTMTMYIMPNLVKIENSSIGSSPGSTMIYRGDKKVVWMLDQQNKSYFEIRQDEQPEQLYSPSGANQKQPSVRKTGKKRQVLGYACEQIIVKVDDLQTEIWATKSLGDVYSTISRVIGSEGMTSSDGWESKIMRMGFYPLIASMKSKGSVVESQEVVRIERKSLPAETFELPLGFMKQSTGGMLEGNSRRE